LIAKKLLEQETLHGDEVYRMLDLPVPVGWEAHKLGSNNQKKHNIIEPESNIIEPIVDVIEDKPKNKK
jgi:hypothetical protein